MQNEFLFERFESIENEEKEILNRKHTDSKNYILGLNISKPVILSKTLSHMIVIHRQLIVHILFYLIVLKG